MYDILDLNNKKVGELKEIAEKLNLTKFDKLKKQELVYKILDEQAINPPKEEKKETVKAEKKPAHKRPVNKKPKNNGSENNRKSPEASENTKVAESKNSAQKEEVLEISESMAKRDDPSRPNPVSRPGDKNGKNKQNHQKKNENRPPKKRPCYRAWI